jgi:hypothetical protein
MNPFAAIGQDWVSVMNAADRLRVVLAFGFIFGAVSHVGWVIVHGDVWYHGPGPDWAPWFWYVLCLVDFGVCWTMLASVRPGVVLGAVTMAVTLVVNWTQFPTFAFQFNYVLIGLTAFGAMMFTAAPWLWTQSRWRLGRPSSAPRSASDES